MGLPSPRAPQLSHAQSQTLCSWVGGKSCPQLPPCSGAHSLLEQQERPRMCKVPTLGAEPTQGLPPCTPVPWCGSSHHCPALMEQARRLQISAPSTYFLHAGECVVQQVRGRRDLVGRRRGICVLLLFYGTRVWEAVQAEGSWTRLHLHLLPQGRQRTLQLCPTPPLSHTTPAPGARGCPTSHGGAPAAASLRAGGQGLGQGGHCHHFLCRRGRGSPGSAQPEEPLLTCPRHSSELGHLGQLEAVLHQNHLIWLLTLCPHILSLTPPCVIFPDSGWN